MKSRDSKSPKKPYHRPRLLVYGDLRTLTQAVGMTAAPDGAPLNLMIKS
ncbi:MAG: hypothetical protein V3V86_02785 [Gammaproteobacteria bacterium]|jgi:hypothetical protein